MHRGGVAPRAGGLRRGDRRPTRGGGLTSPIEVCAECGFDGSAWTDAEAIDAISGLPGRWSDAIAGLSDTDLQRRPMPTMWSIAEYIDHVREVLFGMRFLSDTAINDPGTDLGEPPDPIFEPEPRVIDIDAALAGLSDEAERLSQALAAAPPDLWTSRVIVSGDELDLHWIARHGVHDPTHHLRDVARLRASL
jgi:DinB superfamily